MATQTHFHQERLNACRNAGADACHILEKAGAEMSDSDKEYVCEEIERIRSQLLADRNPSEGYATMFDDIIEKKLEAARKETDGGRPPDTAKATATHALADLYIQAMGGQIDTWKLPAGQNSYFPRFAAAALSPLYDDPNGNLVSALAKFWDRERKKMKPFNMFSDSEVLSSAE